MESATWRVHWVACLTLLRAVGHILDKVDGETDARYRAVVTAKWDDWHADKRATGIFWDFIEAERNNLLKEYKFGVEPEPEYLASEAQKPVDHPWFPQGRLMSDEAEFAPAYQAVGEYFCVFSAMERELGEAVKVVLGLQNHQAADFVVVALQFVQRKAMLVRAAVAVAKNADGSETSMEWKNNATKTVGEIFSLSDDRNTLAHGHLPDIDLSWLMPLSEPVVMLRRPRRPSDDITSWP